VRGAYLLIGAAALCSACVSRPLPHLVALPVMPGPAISGSWCYRGAYENIIADYEDDSTRDRYAQAHYPDWNIRRRERGFTALPFYDVQVHTPILVARRDDSVSIQYQRRGTSETLTRSFPVTAESGGVVQLALPNPRMGTSLVIGPSSRSLDLTVGSDGRPAIIEHYRERGLGLLVIPVRHHAALRANLDPMARCTP
jgi:hypothetical protein